MLPPSTSANIAPPFFPDDVSKNKQFSNSLSPQNLNATAPPVKEASKLIKNEFLMIFFLLLNIAGA